MTPAERPPVIVWFRRDLRLRDNPALHAAVETGAPVIALFIRDGIVDDMGACAKWRLGLSLAKFVEALDGIGATLVLRSGTALEVLRDVIGETGAHAVHYTRDYTPSTIARDVAIKAALTADGIEVESHAGLVLFEPWTVKTQTGGYYRVYTPFWKAVRDRSVAAPLAAPQDMQACLVPPSSEALADWKLGQGMHNGAQVVAAHMAVGEQAALDRLDTFTAGAMARYKADRDRLDKAGTSGLAENLTYGEISPRTIWHRGQAARDQGIHGAEKFLMELVWRDFAYHLMFHSPAILTQNWRDGWQDFPWTRDASRAETWRRGMTGEPVVDAAMRELYATGQMHNRARMIVASYLTKHLLVDWRVGQEWFAETLADWDPASNAMGWQWVAGTGPDASPFFRIFNPATQAEKFDPEGRYRAEYLDPARAGAKAFFAAIPQSWSLTETSPRPDPMVDLKRGRERALEAWQTYIKPRNEQVTKDVSA